MRRGMPVMSGPQRALGRTIRGATENRSGVDNLIVVMGTRSLLAARRRIGAARGLTAI